MRHINYFLCATCIAATILPLLSAAEEPIWPPNAIEVKQVDDLEESIFAYWPHATGIIKNEKLFIAQLREAKTKGCVFALYKLENGKYYLNSKSTWIDCGYQVNLAFRKNALEIEISWAGSKSSGSSAYKFSKYGKDYTLIGIEQRSMQGIEGVIYEESTSMNLLNSTIKIDLREYCSKNSYKEACKIKTKAGIFTLGKTYSLNNFDYDSIENEIRSKMP